MTEDPKPKTARAELGARAEQVAVEHLQRAGIEILGRNVRIGRYEIDVVARDGPVIVVVEVRTRGAGSFLRALDSIDHKKQSRLRAAGERLWHERYQNLAGVERMRFDCISVTFDDGGDAVVEHVKGAF